MRCFTKKLYRIIWKNYSIKVASNKRIRHHVNPLSAHFLTPIHVPPGYLDESFANKNLPFIVDVGCSKGEFPLIYAANHGTKNILGLDIRSSVVDIARNRKNQLELRNVNFLQCNANINLSNLLSLINIVSCVEIVTIQFPDPYFKKKQSKRRLVTHEFVSMLGSHLHVGCQVFLQTDVEDLMSDMREVFQSCPASNLFQEDPIHSSLRATSELAAVYVKPFSECGARERQCLEDAKKIYQLLLHRV